jgi:hypothetical protein
MAKETALLICLWILVLEGCVLCRERFRLAAIGPAVRGALLFLIPAASYVALRIAFVGVESKRLTGSGKSVWERIASLGTDLPDYALIGGLPLPFGFFSHEVLEPARPFGWLVVGTAVLFPAILIARQLRREGRVSRALGIYTFGVAVILISLAPVVWADLGLRRRYFFMPSIGTVLMAAVVIQWLAARRARLARGLLIVLTLAGALGMFQRNELYRQAGEITRSLIQTVRTAALERPGSASAEEQEKRRLVLLTVPRYLGGDSLLGVYVLHWTDAYAALRLAGFKSKQYSTGLKCYHAEDYQVEATFEDAGVIDLSVSFRTRRAYEHARSRNPARDARDWPPQRAPNVQAVLESKDDEAKRLRYRVSFTSSIDTNDVLLIYSDGEFRRLAGPG